MAKKEELTFDERLLACVDVAQLHTLLKAEGYDVPPAIDKDVLGMLRITASKYRRLGSIKAAPKKLSEMSKALRPVLSGDMFADEVFMRRWFFLPHNANANFVRGWHGSIYAPSTPALAEPSPITDLVEHTLIRGQVLQIAAIEQRIPRTIRFRRGTYAYTVFNFTHACIFTELTSSATPVRRSRTKIGVSTEELSAALLLLKKGSSEVVHMYYQPGPYLVLANDEAFVAFTKWTKDFGPLPFSEKISKRR
jgi:hypothetical protein